jgi:hypothetical protein
MAEIKEPGSNSGMSDDSCPFQAMWDETDRLAALFNAFIMIVVSEIGALTHLSPVHVLS